MKVEKVTQEKWRPINGELFYNDCYVFLCQLDPLVLALLFFYDKNTIEQNRTNHVFVFFIICKLQ